MFLWGGDLYISSSEDTQNKVIFAYNKNRSHAQSKWERDAAYLISAQRRAVNDNHIPYYLVSTLVDNKAERSFSATHLKNCALFIYSEDWLNSPREELIKVTTHELFHHWIGHKIKASSDYLNSMWFFEGFNDFLSIEIAFKSGLLTKQAYIDIKNRVLTAHYISPFQSISNREIALYYWNNPELHGAPYIKGHLFAQFCHQILKKKGRSLFDVISILLQNKKFYNQNEFTETDLINALAHLISFDIYEAYVKYFIKCEKFRNEIDLNLESHLLEYITVEFPKYDIDIINTFLSNKIVGLSDMSEAYKLGLREGQLVNRIEIDPLQKSKNIKIQIFDYNNSLKKITLNSHHIKILIPTFNEIK